ncbi:MULTISPECIES: GntR family transcriptional regulator [Vagococcus]|uniref:Transcriptional regulator, GntR family n=1 Tax=Vagococcus fluvialis bH819 TaxID=1255619 RepID=A0A1X6WQ70_9ENTE|nr:MULTISPECIES: GntR family transcriptional regulator [Vagococcus]SLM86491.1 Transcriptional regulator, GntR family [Vagococcus fluvialis bH819]HCM90699.1 GntR family transcriptional regulator [Vagococcus sp.]
MKKSRMQLLAYNYIKDNIEKDKWENEVRLVEQDISNELQISRTPIREAINSLILEGYLEKEVNRGVTVKKQIISVEEFVERTQLLELLLSNYLFQLQVKRLKFDTSKIKIYLINLEDEKDFSKKKLYLGEILLAFLGKLENKVVKQIIIKNFQQLHYIVFPNETPNFLNQEINDCMIKLCDNIEKNEYELARKTIRVFFNRLNLELIDQQI